MKLKRYEAPTEEAAIEKVKSELGQAALILSVKKIAPRGFFRFFRKPVVEVTAAYDDIQDELDIEQSEEAEQEQTAKINDEVAFERDKLLFDQMAKNKKISEQQAKIDNLQEELKSMAKKLSVGSFSSKAERVYSNSLLQLFYDTLISQDVLPEIAAEILNEAELASNSSELDINFVVKLVYNKIHAILTKSVDTKVYRPTGGKARTVMLMGPTGVGKTTTIAKLSSNYILHNNYNVGLITADTYRIAAVEQLKTYADILGIEVGIVYEPEELLDKLNLMLGIYDIIIVDTAGRSHKNKENFEELKRMIFAVKDVNIEKYLVLSMTTKLEDMFDIIDRFSEMCEFKIIFTKLDETLTYGALLNVCYKTGKKVDYLTTGQNVPDDIEKMEPDKAAKALLGLEGVL